MSASLVGSEMCIRDSLQVAVSAFHRHDRAKLGRKVKVHRGAQQDVRGRSCLLYTSDAADDM
eukprot:1304195-Alexandrium_andersonii.AAC.1